MKDTLVVSGFPAIGKTHFSQSTSLNILDSDSSEFSWISNGVRNPDFPNNYIEHIKSQIGKVDVILVSSHKVIRDTLKENSITYILVYPKKELKEEYLQRCRNRGNDGQFIEMIEENWDDFIDEIEQEWYPIKRRLDRGQYLSDLMHWILPEKR